MNTFKVVIMMVALWLSIIAIILSVSNHFSLIEIEKQMYKADK